MEKKITRIQYDRIAKRLEQLKADEVVINQKIIEAKEFGDFRENSELDNAKQELNMNNVEQRKCLKALDAEVVEISKDTIISVGSLVYVTKILSDKDKQEFTANSIRQKFQELESKQELDISMEVLDSSLAKSKEELMQKAKDTVLNGEGDDTSGKMLLLIADVGDPFIQGVLNTKTELAQAILGKTGGEYTIQVGTKIVKYLVEKTTDDCSQEFIRRYPDEGEFLESLFI